MLTEFEETDETISISVTFFLCFDKLGVHVFDPTNPGGPYARQPVDRESY